MKRFCLDVSGEFACFTRPEMKVERVSYDVITPSAARAVFESIFWKPAVVWHVRRIEVLAPIQWINLRRNEVKSKVSVSAVVAAMNGGSDDLGIFADEPDERVQRAGLFLRDVRYRLHADLEVRADRTDPGPEQKFYAMFERRAMAGQCVNQPYLGCREFAARFRLVTDASQEPPAIPDSRDLGWMLHDLDFTHPADPQAVFYRAQMKNGSIEVNAQGTAQ